jgi:hypothetical protein
LFLKIELVFDKLQVIVACLATMAMSAPTDTRPTTTIVADGPEGRLLEAEEPGKGFWGYIRLVY